MLPALRIHTLFGALVASLVAVAPPAGAQTPAIYEATAHGRVLSCFGEAYALVELIDVSTQNLALINVELRRTPSRPAFAAGLVLTGTQLDQKQSLEVAARLVECTEGAARRAAPDAGAAYTANAVREEIDVALMMAEGFASDYQMMAARLMTFFGESTDAAARVAPIRGIGRYGDELRSTLQRSRTAIDIVITRSRVAP
jgi:hypothetical protein